LPGAPLDKGGKIYQEYTRLTEIRNELVHIKAQVETVPHEHFKPEDRKVAPDFMVFFESKGWTYNRKNDQSKLAGWIGQIQTPQVARWACRISATMILNIIERLAGTGQPIINDVYDCLHFQWRNIVSDERVKI